MGDTGSIPTASIDPSLLLVSSSIPSSLSLLLGALSPDRSNASFSEVPDRSAYPVGTLYWVAPVAV